MWLLRKDFGCLRVVMRMVKKSIVLSKRRRKEVMMMSGRMFLKNVSLYSNRLFLRWLVRSMRTARRNVQQKTLVKATSKVFTDKRITLKTKTSKDPSQVILKRTHKTLSQSETLRAL